MAIGRGEVTAAVLAALLLAACRREAREIGPSLSQTPPHGADDARVA